MFVLSCFCLLLISVQSIQCDQFQAKYKISLGSTISVDASVPQKDGMVFYDEFVIKPYSISTINLHNFTDHKFGFGILQVHSCWYNLTLSYNETIQRNYYENGTNLGFTLYPSRQSPQRFFIHNYHYFTSVNISVVFISYNKTTPEPGGCNLEFSVADAPYLVITSGKDILTVDTPLAADRADQLIEAKRCNASLSYTGHHVYLRRGDFSCQTFFKGIKSMMTVESSIANGRTGAGVPGLVNRRTYVKLPGTGIVFQTVVKGKGGASVYIPTFSTSCSPQLWETKCSIFATSIYHVLAVILIIVGIVRAFFDKVLKTTGVLIDGFIVGVLITFYIIQLSDLKISEDRQRFTLIGSGFVVAITLSTLFVCYEVTQRFIGLTTNIIVGYLLGAFSVFMADDGLYAIKSSGWTYETIFFGYIVCMMIILPPCHSLSSIILSAIWGSFCIIQASCYICGNHLNYMILNALRYTSVEGFKLVHSTPAINGEDVCFLCLWLILAISGITFQLNLKIQPQDINDSDAERAPLISRMTQYGSDEVFESPLSNVRFLQRLRRQHNYVH